MITIHRQIKKLSDNHVLSLVLKFGDSLKDVKPKFENLPRFSIDLSGAPINIDISKLILHAAAASGLPIQYEISHFFFTQKKSFINSKGVSKVEILPSEWTKNINRILLAINNVLTITYKNGLWELFPAMSLVEIEEIRDLVAKIRQKQNEQIGGNVYMDIEISSKGSVHLGNIIYSSESDKNDTPKEEASARDKEEVIFQIINKIKQGNLGEAITILLSISKHSKGTFDDLVILLAARYERFKFKGISGEWSEEEKTREFLNINKALLEIVKLMKR